MVISEHSRIFYVIYAITLPRWGEIRLVCLYIVHVCSVTICASYMYMYSTCMHVLYVHVLNIHVHACMLTFIGVSLHTCYSISE